MVYLLASKVNRTAISKIVAVPKKGGIHYFATNNLDEFWKLIPPECPVWPSKEIASSKTAAKYKSDGLAFCFLTIRTCSVFYQKTTVVQQFWKIAVNLTHELKLHAAVNIRVTNPVGV